MVYEGAISLCSNLRNRIKCWMPQSERNWRVTLRWEEIIKTGYIMKLGASDLRFTWQPACIITVFCCHLFTLFDTGILSQRKGRWRQSEQLSSLASEIVPDYTKFAPVTCKELKIKCPLIDPCSPRKGLHVYAWRYVYVVDFTKNLHHMIRLIRCCNLT